MALALVVLGAVWAGSAEAATVSLSGTNLTVTYTAADATPESVTLVNDGT